MTPKTGKQSTGHLKLVSKDNRLFTLEVCIIDGPMKEEFIEKNPVICRTIQMRGDQTLETLHAAIFKAFDREDHHWYEFQVGGKGPMDPQARRYVIFQALGGVFDDTSEAAGDVSQTALGAIGLKTNDVFGYWFDFGDDWWHQISVVSIEDTAPRGRYPKVTNRIGDSPPQYGFWEEEGEE